MSHAASASDIAGPSSPIAMYSQMASPSVDNVTPAAISVVEPRNPPQHAPAHATADAPTPKPM